MRYRAFVWLVILALATGCATGTVVKAQPDTTARDAVVLLTYTTADLELRLFRLEMSAQQLEESPQAKLRLRALEERVDRLRAIAVAPRQ